MSRSIYLNLMDPGQAREKWFAKIENECEKPGTEKTSLQECAQRVTAAAILAERSSPAFHGAAMDGYAVAADKTFHASPRAPVRLEVGKDCWPINTGQPLPPDTNAIVMIEDVNPDESGNFITLEKAVWPWQHVRKTGEDIVQTEVILPPGTLIGPEEIGALAAGGVMFPEVFRKGKVAIIPTGSDLVELKNADGEKLRQGKQLPEFNSLIFSAMLKAAGAEPHIMPIAPDDPEAIRQSLLAAEKTGAELVLLNAGTSAGDHDYSNQVLKECGEIIAHGVKLMPGKPVLLAISELNGRKLPVAGIPGYPVSAFLAMEEFVLPLLAFWQKKESPKREKMSVLPLNHLASRPGMEERVRVKIGVVDDKAWAVPLPRGAGTVTSLSRADAIISIPADSEGINQGQPVAASLLKPRAQIEGAILAVGSHDPSLDLLDSLLRKSHHHFSLTSAHVGSLGGLIALARGQAHLAGTHLLDSATGIYNQKAIQEYLGEMSITLVRLANRWQGLILPTGNPLGIKSLEDIAQSGARFINRQRGSGTRVLLDYKLAQLDLAPDSLLGYEDEEYTHMSVAQAVLSGRADAGLGVASAARALNLDFIPIGHEEYDLAIPTRFMKDARVAALLDIIRSEEFKNILANMGGYELSRSGEIIWEKN